ncbi:MAG: hypothetical protein J0L84_15060, partial [Verrucomicrobia bacterium]|nr:hypothetical protein [Verrucomicrobiota bacterium]
LRNLNAGMVEGTDGWIFLVAQSGGEGNCGGIVRCRKDGTEASVWLNFATLSGPPRGTRPDREILAGMTKSPLAFARDGSLYGSMRQRLFNLTYRVASDGAPGIVQFNRWNGGDQGQVTNDLGGFTWLGTFPRGICGGFVEAADGHLYGVAQQEWNGDYPEFPAAIQRIQIPGGTLETLSQSSLLTEHFSYLQDGSYFQRTTPGVAGRDGVLYFGSFHGVLSFRPGWNGIQPLRRTGPAHTPKPRPRGPIVRGPSGHFLAVAPDNGALHAGTLSLIGPDRPWHRVIHSFSGGAGDVLEPSGFLAAGDFGWIYGTSQRGNAHEFFPKLWRVHDTTGAFEVLATLPGRYGGGADLPCGLMRGRDGRFYGTTPRGGAANLGTIFVFDAQTGRLIVLHEFGASAPDRGQPWPQLTEAKDGLLYGLLSGENLESGTPDRWFRIATDGSRYEMLGLLPHSPEGGLEITGGLTEDSTGHFYCVRALSALAPTTAPVMGQLFRLTPPGPNDESGSADLVFENASGTAPHVSPVGPLMPLPDGTLLGLSRSPQTVLYALDPATGSVRTIHRPRMRGGTGSLEYADRFTAAVLESAVSIVLPIPGSLLRLDLSPPPMPQPIAGLRVSGSYGELLSHLYPQDVFHDAPYLTGASGLPEGIRYFGHDEGARIGSIAGTFQTTGTFLAEAYTTDGQWPEGIVTNRITFEVAPRLLTLRGPVASWIIGEPRPLPEPTVEGLLAEDAGRLSITWRLPEGAATRPGTHAILPDIQDPDGPLNLNLVSVEPGRLTVVDRGSRIVTDGDDRYLEFPRLPGHYLTVWEGPSLRSPWCLVHQTLARPGRTNRFHLEPSQDESVRFFRIEATR